MQTHHLSVTWPFWTRFMLKPTVGMELCDSKSVLRVHYLWRAGGRGVVILDREFTALDAQFSFRWGSVHLGG